MSAEWLDNKSSNGAVISTAGTSPRGWRQDLLLIASIIVVLTLLIGAYARPWLSLVWSPGGDLATYVPLVDGQTSIRATLDAAGKPIRWTSSTVRRLPVQQALSGRPRLSVGKALDDRYPGAVEIGVLPGVDVWEIRSRILERNGDLINESVVFVREDEGDFLLNVQHQPGPLDLSFTPALWSSPTSFAEGQRWSSTGVRSDMLPYQFDGRLLARGAYSASLGLLEECWQVETQTVISSTDSAVTSPLVQNETEQWNCAGVGTVAFTNRSADGTVERTVLVASTLLPDAVVDSKLLPPSLGVTHTIAARTDQTAPRVDPASWSLSRLAKILPGDQLSVHSSIPPVYLDGEPPLILSAVRESELTAFELSGVVNWRFYTGGTIYSPPSYDPMRGRIYFGSSNKTLYAIDTKGFFVWSVRAFDNIATRPLLVPAAAGDLVLFGSEDRSLYAVDAEQGVVRWQYETSGPIVSGLAQTVVDGIPLVLFGNDDGGVYALDGNNGDPQWQFAADDAVEAPVVLVAGTALVAGRNGVLYALDAKSGDELWQSTVTKQALRTAPVVYEDRIYVIDDGNALHILDRATGRKLYSQVTIEVAGSPVVLEDRAGQPYLVAAGYEGAIYHLDTDGNVLDEIDSGVARVEAIDGSTNSFEFGPVYGGGALWLADDTGILYRLGPPVDSEHSRTASAGNGTKPVSVQLAWMQQAIVYPFRQGALSYTPLTYDDRNLVLDSSTNLYTIDPSSGDAQFVSTIAEGGYLQAADPVLTRDTLYVTIDGQLYAVDPSNGNTRWQHKGLGQSFTPPVADDETVVWLTTAPPDENDMVQGVLIGFDATQGERQWEVPLADLLFPSGIVLDRGVVYPAATPAAYDADTGALLWTSAVDGVPGVGGGSSDGDGIGIPGLDPAGDILYVCHLDRETDAVHMVAYHTEDGQVQWRARLDEQVLSPFERAWVAGDVLVVPALSGSILGLDRADGSERWRYTPPAPRFGAVTVIEGRIWTLLQNGDLLVLDAATGRVIGQMVGLELELSTSSYVQRPLIRDKTVTAALGLALLGYRVEP